MKYGHTIGNTYTCREDEKDGLFDCKISYRKDKNIGYHPLAD